MGSELESKNIAQPNQTPHVRFDKGDIITRPVRHELLRRAESQPDGRQPVVLTGHATHSHDYPLLIHVVSGFVEVKVARGGARQGTQTSEDISLGAESSLWLGVGVEHAVRARRDSIMLGPRLSPDTEPPDGHLRLGHAPAIREIALLILAASPASEPERIPFRHALDHELREIAVDDFFLPQASDRAVLAITADPMSLLLPLRSLAERHSMSPRHIERIIKADLGISFVHWRTRRRLNLALRRIRAGASCRSAARAVGYDGSDGLIKAAGRMTGLPRPVLAADLAGALRAWKRAPGHAPSGIHADPS